MGRLRGFFLPFGLFALLAVGIHVGSDRLDDHLFVLFNVLDGWFDEAARSLIEHVSSWFDASRTTIDALTFRAQALIDLELKQEAARFFALVLELSADFVLALPVFLYRQDVVSPRELGAMLKKSFTDPTLLAFVAPISALCASVAGAFAVSREVQVLAHSLISETGLREDLGLLAASMFGFVALAIMAWRLASVVMVGTVKYARRRAANDVTLSVPRRTRVLRGFWTAVVALPIAILAIDATPIVGTIRALLWM